MDYDETEEPAAFSPLEEENYREEDDYPAHGDGQEDQNENTDEFPANFAEVVDSIDGKRSRIFHEGERRRKASRSIGVGSPQQEDNNSQSEEDQMDSAQKGHVCCPIYGGGDVERAIIDNPSLRESESSSKSVAIPSKGKVSPLIHPGNPSRRESESINIPNSTRGNPSKGESESQNNSKLAHGNPSKGESKSTSTSNVGRFIRGGRRIKSPMGKRPGGMSRRNARTHSPSIHLVSQRASALCRRTPSRTSHRTSNAPAGTRLSNA